MPEYVLNRNYTHRSLMGHTISFEKGQPTYVPPECEKEVVAFGADRVVGDNPDVLPEDVVVEEVPQGSDREAMLNAAFEQIEARNDTKDFTAQGVPTIKAVEKIVGFNVEKAEVLDAWREYRVAKAEAQ